MGIDVNENLRDYDFEKVDDLCRVCIEIGKKKATSGITVADVFQYGALRDYLLSRLYNLRAQVAMEHSEFSREREFVEKTRPHKLDGNQPDAP